MKKFLLTMFIGIFGVSAFVLTPKIMHRLSLKETEAFQQSIELPKPEIFLSSSSVSSSSFSSSVVLEKDGVNYDVPFVSQAPLLVWDELHQEACEETSILMVMKYFNGENIQSLEEADDEIVGLVAANTALGFAVDDTAEEAALLLRTEAPHLSVDLLYEPTVEHMKSLLSSGKLIIAPLQGQYLGNPYYTAPGPRYHMLVLKGYINNSYFITNDPGTKRGKDYVYSFDVFMNAIHDWNDGDVENGQKVVIVVGGA